MQTIGFNVQKNNSPAFGCKFNKNSVPCACDRLFTGLLKNGISEENADKYLKEKTAPLKAGLFRKARSHESMAEYEENQFQKDPIGAIISFFKDSGGCVG